MCIICIFCCLRCDDSCISEHKGTVYFLLEFPAHRMFPDAWLGHTGCIQYISPWTWKLPDLIKTSRVGVFFCCLLVVQKLSCFICLTSKVSVSLLRVFYHSAVIKSFRNLDSLCGSREEGKCFVFKDDGIFLLRMSAAVIKDSLAVAWAGVV